LTTSAVNPQWPSLSERQALLRQRFPVWQALSLDGLLAKNARDFPDRSFVITDRRTWTYAQMHAWSVQLAAGLVSKGVKPGDHVALLMGTRDSSPPVVRLHSECLTGDVLGSLKCDCGPQLHEALQQISDARWGILLYLRQEGRGIGLINKLRAYALQDQGFDTVDANTRLGFAIDARDFSVAARMLQLLGVDRVRLLTNNPEKVGGLQDAGITVEERLPLKIVANPHNAHYLETKKSRTGHAL